MNSGTRAALGLSALALAVGLASGMAHAQLRPPVINVNSEFGIAFQGFSQSYTETVSSAKVDSEHGIIPGAEVKATTMFDALGIENLYAGVRYQYEGGGVSYNGAFLNGTPHNGTTQYAVNDIGIEFGKGFLLSDNVLITPFVQGGWRGWERDLSSVQVEDYTHYYLGGGVRGDLGITDQLVLTGRLGIAETVASSVTAQASVPLGLPHMVFQLSGAPLYQAGAGADYKFYTFLHLYGGVDFTHFSYGVSAVNSFGFFEPNSVTNEFVFRLGLAIGF